ncbi:CRP-like cAMP-binding protein [Neorhizobium huautlense]|uniref:CRP-like cAMP-binding protein n=1 Tax=Neorhizobium huautlense TaxID=67774 RepID=A0ABT9PMT1_9HYPH|nr:Crp/Fnr family transcriptional regulator [Neorhizobium huautlense]MDP9835520.1 CRP-like cAMP-binding protein [Neorhizobium huautlense]
MSMRNRLLASLSPDDLEAVRPWLEDMPLPQKLELSLPGEETVYCYFPTDGIGSTVIVSPEGNQTEIGVFGREGMSPASAVLGATSNPYRVVMQVGGRGYRIARTKLIELMEERPALHRLLLRWAQVFTAQAATTALSNAVHSVDERLARWVLMCHDRLGGDEMSLTHEFLSIMLAVRRPSVTTALHVLEGNKLIYSHRANIIVRDREGLEAFASDAYGVSEHEYARLLGDFRER